MPTSEQNPNERPIVPRVLLSEIDVKKRVEELGQEITRDYQGKNVVAVCILNGSFVFFSDLIRHIEVPLTCEFLGCSSYGDKTTSSGEVKITLDIAEPLKGKHVLIVEDIVDSGLTLDFINHLLQSRQPASVKSVALLFKPERLKTDLNIDYVGFRIGNEFVVGYGIDYAGKFRGLPFVGYIEREH